MSDAVAGGRRRLPRMLGKALGLAWAASRRSFIVAASLQVVSALAVSALVVVGKLALDAVLAAQETSSPTRSLVPVVLLLAFVTAVGSGASIVQQQQQQLMSEQVSATVWRRVLDVTGRVGLEAYETSRFYDQLQRVASNAVIQPITVTTAVFGLIGGAAGTAGLLVVLVAIEPLLVPVLVLAGVPAVLLSQRASRAEFRFATAITPLYRSREYLRSVLTGRDEAKEVRAFAAESALRSRHDKRSDTYVDALRRHVRIRQGYALGGVAVTTTALAVALGLLVTFVSQGRISLADAGAAALGIRLLSSRLDSVFRSVGDLLEASVFLSDLEDFLALTPQPEPPGTGTSLPSLRTIRLENVSYVYPGSEQPAVEDVSLEIAAGEVVAVVGENGSGKTTLAKLIAGLYPPSEGRIRWDGVDASELPQADLRRAVAIIFQDFVQYQLTALDNIGLGDPEHVEDEAAARAAADKAGIAGVLDRLPEGFGTILSKEYAGGHELSAGEWQRVALARALRRDAPLVILDEPSAALDPRAEHALFEDVRGLLAGRSGLLISHRYSTVRSVDRIYVMSGGRVVESGSHDTLMAAEGLYAELFTLQARAYL